MRITSGHIVVRIYSDSDTIYCGYGYGIRKNVIDYQAAHKEERKMTYKDLYGYIKVSTSTENKLIFL